METYLDHLHKRPDGQQVRLAARVMVATQSRKPGLVWFGGFKSDMMGTKAESLVDVAREQGVASMRFDYSGHGESDGEFTDGTISKWVAESVDIFCTLTGGPQILVGSSMGGWIVLRLLQELQKREAMDRVASVLLIAPAPDFTNMLMEPAFTDEQKQEMEESGRVLEPSEYSPEPNIITRQLIDDGRNNKVLDQNLVIGKPVHILQGMQDPDVPYQHALRLMEGLVHDDVTMTLIRDGDHRLSRDQDIETLKRTVTRMITDFQSDQD